MLAFLSSIAGFFLVSGGLRTFPWLQASLPHYYRQAQANIQLAGLQSYDLARDFFRNLFWGTFVFLGAVIGLVFWSQKWVSIKPVLVFVLILGVLYTIFMMYALVLLRLAITEARDRMRSTGSWIFNHIPLTVVPVPAVQGGFWTVIGKAMLWIPATLINGLYMIPALPLKTAGGAMYALGELLGLSVKVAIRMARWLAFVGLALQGVICLTLVDIWFGKNFVTPLFMLVLMLICMIWGTIFVLAEWIVTSRLATPQQQPQAAATSTISGGLPFLAGLMGVIYTMVLLFILWASYEPRMAKGVGRVVNNCHSKVAKVLDIFGFSGERTDDIYVEAVAYIPVQYRRVEVGGKIAWEKVETPVCPGTVGVKVVASDSAETRRTRRAMVRVVWASKEDPDLVMVDQRLEKKEAEALWVPDEDFIIEHLPEAPQALLLNDDCLTAKTAAVADRSIVAGACLSAPPEYTAIVDKWLVQFPTVPRNIGLALPQHESKWDPNAISKRGAVGHFQLTEGTALRYRVTDRTDPDQSARGGLNFMSDLLKEFGNIRIALAAYNAGDQQIRDIMKANPTAKTWEQLSPFLPEETRVKMVPGVMDLAEGRCESSPGILVAGMEGLPTFIRFNQKPNPINLYLLRGTERILVRVIQPGWGREQGTRPEWTWLLWDPATGQDIETIHGAEAVKKTS